MAAKNRSCALGSCLRRSTTWFDLKQMHTLAKKYIRQSFDKLGANGDLVG